MAMWALLGLSAAFLVGTAVDARAECRPVAVPIGDPALVQSVRERLIANGIATELVAGCPSVRVHLEWRGEQLHLRVADGYQRQSEREVRDIATAAAVIESWTLQEIEAGSLPDITEPPAALVTSTAVVQRPERASIAVVGSASVATDRSAWLGGELAGCVRAGRLCLGASAMLAADTATTDDATRGAQRSKELGALATVELPLARGSFTVSPGLGVGYGWTNLARQHTDAQAMPLSVETPGHSLRTRLQIMVSRDVGRGLALAALLFGELAPARFGFPDGLDVPRARIGLSLGLRVGLR